MMVPERRYAPGRPELMDEPAVDRQLLADELKNLRVINRWFGGLSAVRKFIVPLIEKTDAARPVRILDLATGSADHPIALVHLARAMGRSVRILAVDRNPAMIEISRERTRGYAEIEVREEDILDMSAVNESFDIALCSLALHHFSHDDGVRILKTMKRLSGAGIIVNELARHWPAAWTAWLYAHLTSTNPLTRNDAYVSVLRGFTAGELSRMASDAGITRFSIHRHPMFRLVLVGGSGAQ